MRASRRFSRPEAARRGGKDKYPEGIMRGTRKFLHPEAIKRITRLELRARHIVEGFLAGMHRSPYFGQSVEFLQHREYATGDDLRHVDWKVWARQDRLYVKQYEEETNLRATLLV